MDNAVKELGYVDGKFNGNWFQWVYWEIKETFKSKAALGIWLFGTGFQLANFLANPINWVSTLTLLASIIGLLCTVCMMRGKAVNGFLGAASVVGFVVVNFVSGHWWSVLDQLIFLCAIDIPLMIAWKTWSGDFEKKARTLNKKGWVITLIAVAIAWVILYFVGLALHDTAPLVDSLVLAIGAIASILCALHYNNTYTLWLAEDVVNILLWISTAIHMGITGSTVSMLVTTIMYLFTAIYGKFISPAWKAGNNNKQASLKNNI